MICGRFEGVDERVLEARAIEELSVGDSSSRARAGGDRVDRRLCAAFARFSGASRRSPRELAEGLLEYPNIRGPTVQERAVPEGAGVGDHRRIREWRRAEADG